MSDTHHYFLSHAREAIVKARRLPRGRVKAKQRVVARVYHLLARESHAADLPRIDDFRTTRETDKGWGI